MLGTKDSGGPSDRPGQPSESSGALKFLATVEKCVIPRSLYSRKSLQELSRRGANPRLDKISRVEVLVRLATALRSLWREGGVTILALASQLTGF